ncbi:hypothetical protein MIND_00360900 [Mycena indigotica]|uniref:Uncharacterized protein n=1 Tax=Mycena indigotica TaxID=2126181 RepID=A0A8H6WB66_9AGAR|nr:uncharacterized protein MIND_00360900 [Mycena indigotica]KAF7309886.1 hypothetical protein MIND_00360900 [Mycena indigotica]
MDPPNTCATRVRITSGSLDAANTKLHRIAAAHPFTRQVDVVFVPNELLKNELVELETVYVSAKVELAKVVEMAEQMQLEDKHAFTALSINTKEDDTWCIDPRTILTMHLSGPTYQMLGGGQSLVGRKVKASRALRGIADDYVVSLPLQLSFHKDRIREKRNEALIAWDKQRSAGFGPWHVAYTTDDTSETIRLATAYGHESFTRQVKCSLSTMTDVRVPNAGIELIKPRPTDPDEADDWDEDMGELFEWVGMAGLGAQRLAANDRVDPFIAVYEAPESFSDTIGDITVIRWTGFLPPEFVQRVIDVCCKSTSFAAITCHGFPTAPVAYIPLGKDGTPSGNTSPPRIPNEDTEDSRCLVISNGRWCLTESISAGDTRWG